MSARDRLRMADYYRRYITRVKLTYGSVVVITSMTKTKSTMSKASS